MADNKCCLKRIHDPKTGQPYDQPLLYDLAAMTTHAVVNGMTGPGKTALFRGSGMPLLYVMWVGLEDEP